MKSRLFLQFFLIALIFLISCAGRSALRMERLVDYTAQNEFLPAIEIIRKNPKLYGKLNQFLYNMDIGVLYHYASVYDSSTILLERAAQLYDELFTRSVTNEAASIIVNDNVRPYRSKPYEIVLLHQIIALNYLAEGKTEDALVETRRVQLLFNEWQRKSKEEKRYFSDAMFHYVSSIAYDAFGEFDNSMISLYNSIKAFQSGSFALPNELKNLAYYQFLLNDRASDNKLLDISADVSKENVPGVGNNGSEIIFIGYAGKGPALDQSTWWGTYVRDGLLILHHNGPGDVPQTVTLPAPPLPESELRKAENGETTSSGTTFHIKFALPAIKTFPSVTKGFSVRCSGSDVKYSSMVINDLEQQAQRHLDETNAVNVARTATRVVLRTIAAQRAKAQMQTSSPMANLLINVGTDVLTDQIEKADTRSCFLIPKTVQIARIPVKPGVYTIDVTALDGSGNSIGSKQFSNITVKNHQKQFVFYSSFK
jgi:hypothetical protein